MVCIHCGAETHIVNSRWQKRANQVWRRRRCLGCEAVFTTEETANYGAAWRVEAKNGSLEAFQRDKLFLSLYMACGHRKTALNDATGLADTVVAKIPAAVRTGVIKSAQIIEITQVALNRFDKAASSYYAARHHTN
jgi:transcriptional regulator NrdR family protein